MHFVSFYVCDQLFRCHFVPLLAPNPGDVTGCDDYIHTYIHTNLYSAKNRENESEALAQDDYTDFRESAPHFSIS